MLLLLLACGTTCEISGPLDYGSDGLWICKPGLEGCPTTQTAVIIDSTGGREEEIRTYDNRTGLACFVVYPTVDSRLGSGMHHEVDSVPGPRAWARHHAAPLGEVCEVWVPIYRQVIIGTYAGKVNEKKNLCLENAYQDVAGAFEVFLEANPDRGFAVFGHSQGSQHLSRLIKERIEGDTELRDRFVAGYLLGWALGTDTGTVTGGSFDEVPVCSDRNTPGCVVGFGGFFDGSRVPERGQFEEGEKRVCVNPASPGVEGSELLTALTLPSTSKLFATPDGFEGQDGVLLVYPGLMTAECVGGDNDALSLRLERPLDYNALALEGELGAHPIDVNVALADVVLDLERRATRWGAR